MNINNNNNHLGIRSKCAAAQEVRKRIYESEKKYMNQKKKISIRKVINDLGILNANIMRIILNLNLNFEILILNMNFEIEFEF